MIVNEPRARTKAAARAASFLRVMTQSALITLQVVSPDDWRAWRDLRLRALEEAPHAFNSKLSGWRGATEQRWRERLCLAGSHNLLAALDDVPSGMASGVMSPERVAEVTSVWVAPEARGKGVGDALLTALSAWALVAGAERMELDVKPINHSAIAAYRRNGFVVRGKRRNHDLVMVRALR